MFEAFNRGGYGMFPTLVFGLVLLAASVRYALRPDARKHPLLWSLGLLTVLAGTLGFVSGLIITSIHVTKPELFPIALIGFGESAHNLALALMLCSLAAICVSVGAFRAEHAKPA